MLKPASLRAALECALPELAANPDRLILYIDEGRIHSRYGDSRQTVYEQGELSGESGGFVFRRCDLVGFGEL